MSGYFDSEEMSELQRRLWESHGQRFGQDQSKFDSCVDVLFELLDSPEGARSLARKIFEQKGVSGDLGGELWDAIVAKALSLASYSLREGLFVTVVMIAALAVMPGIPQLPAWTRSDWVQGVLGIGVLVGIINIFRGSLSLLKLKGVMKR